MAENVWIFPTLFSCVSCLLFLLLVSHLNRMCYWTFCTLLIWICFIKWNPLSLHKLRQIWPFWATLCVSNNHIKHVQPGAVPASLLNSTMQLYQFLLLQNCSLFLSIVQFLINCKIARHEGSEVKVIAFLRQSVIYWFYNAKVLVQCPYHGGSTSMM